MMAEECLWQSGMTLMKTKTVAAPVPRLYIVFYLPSPPPLSTSKIDEYNLVDVGGAFIIIDTTKLT